MFNFRNFFRPVCLVFVVYYAAQIQNITLYYPNNNHFKNNSRKNYTPNIVKPLNFIDSCYCFFSHPSDVGNSIL